MAAGLRRLSGSAAEITTLVARAARGGGAPPGQAARFGQVAALHLMSGRDPDILQAALEALPDGPILSCPLTLDRALDEAGRGVQALLRDATRDELMRSFVEALPFHAVLEDAGGSAMRLRGDFGTPRPPRASRRIEGCAALVARMQDLAAATLVPDSDRSRGSGAGAGLIDND